jgi:hypothetical protein
LINPAAHADAWSTRKYVNYFTPTRSIGVEARPPTSTQPRVAVEEKAQLTRT